MRIAPAAVVVILGVSACATAPKEEPITREEVMLQADRIGFEEGVDRDCVIDTALKNAPNAASVSVVNPATKPEHVEQQSKLIRAIKIGAAIKAAKEECSVAGSFENGEN